MTFWSGKRVLVTGGGGFVGSHLVERLVAHGARVTVLNHPGAMPRRNLEAVWSRIQFEDVDLMQAEPCRRALQNQEIVLHLAAKVSGVRFNQAHPAMMLRDNVQLALNVLEASREAKAERVLMVSSACVYPRACTIPTPETEGFRDDPEPTNFGYGWAKRVVELLAQTYAEEFGMRIAIARPYNAYGPRDHFESPDAHVIASLIHRLMDGENPLTVWGDGTASRSFVYVTDLARGLMELVEQYPQPDPVNLGTDEEVSIRDLAEMIVRLSGKRVTIQFDPSRPSGQPRRQCNTTKAKRLIGYTAAISLEEGLTHTLAWYESHCLSSTARR
ncbi:MAG: NAD-dependent epimerase/dehydratase family protein [Candidatus Omnitrophica bacterium]|nr:NAD-dependent epimerase/dehydratase family protein [Candidatus Omnitrophota bacterium]